jgi:hypothetical protein
MTPPGSAVVLEKPPHREELHEHHQPGPGEPAGRRAADAVFALLSNPSRHPDFDGSGMIVSPATSDPLTGVGDVFTMRMHNEEMGDDVIDNHVVEFVPDRRIAWEPVLSAASREEDRESIGNGLHHRWGYELEAAGPDATLVTEFFDCSRSPEDFQRVLRGGSVGRRRSPSPWRRSSSSSRAALRGRPPCPRRSMHPARR